MERVILYRAGWLAGSLLRGDGPSGGHAVGQAAAGAAKTR